MTPSDHQAGEAKGFFPETTTASTDTDANNTTHQHTVSEDRAARSRPRSEADSDHSTQVCETETDTRTKTGTKIDDSADSDPDNLDDDDDALLPTHDGGTVVYHAIAPADNDDDEEADRTLCNKSGSYRRVPVTQAREEADRYCRACAAKQNGTDRRPCPTCGRLIGVTYWPQHVRQCDGTPNHPNRPHATDSDSDSDADATTSGRES